MTTLTTQFEFLLPKGYMDADGTLHREGTMRLSTAADEILPLKDPRVQSNAAYLVCILLARVVTRLGSLDAINPKVIEGLYAADLHYLQDFYNHINGNGKASMNITCPHCEQSFELERPHAGEL